MTRKTPLFDEHKKLGAKIVDFAGFEMPVQYSGVIDEHQAVRHAAGLFDVSHMGEIELEGPGALAMAQHLTVGDVTKLKDGQAQYSVLCNERGTTIDDIIAYRLAADRILFVVNASNCTKDFSWINSHCTRDVTVKDRSDEFALIALQGPEAEAILKKCCPLPLSDIASFSFLQGKVSGHDGCLVARTGYTGEAGFEIFAPADVAPHIWREILAAGKSHGIKPAGLGCRDTLRLEMCYCLYGHELSDEINPLEAGLGWVVKLTTPDDFIGKQALLALREKGLARKLVGFHLLEPGIPRSDYPILSHGERIGYVTSGTMSPTLGEAIGLGFVPTHLATVGSKFSIDIRGRARQAEAVKTPFYKKKL